MTDVLLFDVVMPKDDPTWRFALGARPESTGVGLEIDAGGVRGHGYASEIPHLGYPISQVKAALAEAAGRLRAVDLLHAGPAEAVVASVRGCPPAAAAVEMAVLDVRARAAGVPLHRLLGAKHVDSVPLMRILALKSPEQVADNAARRVAEGYHHLKIKLDNTDAGLDADRVAAVRDRVGPDIHLILDANQSYSAEQALAFYPLVHPYGIDIFEQPVPESDHAGLALLTRELPCAVDADESARSLAAVTELARTRAVDSVSLKLLKLGGLTAMRQAADTCRAHDVRFRIGAHVGSRLLNSAALQLAVTLPDLFYACELAEFARLLNDPFDGLEIETGSLRLPSGAGSGLVLREVPVT